MISKANRYDIKGRKYIGANLKYYFTDPGLRNARLNFRQQEPTHIMENIVYNELLIRGYNVDVGVVQIFDKDKEGKRSEDQGTGAYAKMFKVRPRVTKAGRYYVDEGEDQKGFKVPLPKTTYKYTYVPDVSTHGDGEYPASMHQRIWLGSRRERFPQVLPEAYEARTLSKRPGQVSEKQFCRGLIACQAKTAKGAVNKLAALLDKYGSEEGNIFCSLPIRRKHGSLKFTVGTTYAAMKMPTDKVAVFGNNS